MSSNEVIGGVRSGGFSGVARRKSRVSLAGAKHATCWPQMPRSTIVALAAGMACSVAFGSLFVTPTTEAAAGTRLTLSKLGRAVAAPRAAAGQIDLSDIAAGSGGFVMNGQCAGDFSGFSIAGAGDVNGDGLADLIVGAPLSNTAAYRYAGRSYVVFGKTGTTATDLSAIAAGRGGFVINGQCFNDESGRSVASAGDVNHAGGAEQRAWVPGKSDVRALRCRGPSA